MSKTKGLGKGFDSLVPVGSSIDIVSTAKHDKIQHIAIKNIKANQSQPRENFDAKELAQLAQSIKEQGILQPIIVSQDEHNMYTIIAGERRWRAAEQVNLKTVPVIVKDVTELQSLEFSILENVQRADLNALELAKSIQRLHIDYQQSYEDIAKRLGKAYTTIVNTMRLLQLPADMQKSLQDGDITEGHARALLSLAKHPLKQKILYKELLKNKLSVRQAEVRAQSLKGNKISKVAAEQVKKTNKTVPLLTKKYGVPVAISGNTKQGRIIIRYSSNDEYKRLIKQLQD